MTVAGGVTLDSEDTRARVDRVEGRAFLDGDAIGVKPASAVAGAQRLALDGLIVFTGPSPRFDLGIAGSLDVAQIVSWFPALPAGNGPVELKGRVTGPLDDPQFKYSARSTGVVLPDIHMPAAVVEGSVSRAGVFIDRMQTAIGGGRVEASGRLPLGPGDPNSRFSLSWAEVPVAGLSKLFARLPADPIGMVATGSARLSWPGAAFEFLTLEGGLESEVRFAPSLRPARVSLNAAPGHWTLRSEQALDGGTTANLETAITINPDDIADSRLSGTLSASSANLGPALVEVARAFPSLPEAAHWIAGSPLTIEGAVDGTLRAPRFSGTAASEHLLVEGLPATRASAAFEATTSQLIISRASSTDPSGNSIEGRAGIDFEAGTTNGAVKAEVRYLEPVLTALLGSGAGTDTGLKGGGTVVLAGEWNGPVSDPVLSVTMTASALSIDGPVFKVDRGSAEGRLGGTLSNPEGTVRVTAGAVRASSLASVPVDAQISLASGRIEVAAQIPDWSATLHGRMSAAAPHDFTADVSMANLTAARFATLLGVADPGWTADGTFSGRLDAAGTLGSRTLHVGGQASLAGGALLVGESRLMEAMNASIEIRDGRLWLTRVAGLGFNGPLSASGDLPLDWVGEYLPEGWRLDGASATPASFALSAEPDVKTLGTWLRPDEPGRMTGALRVRASGTAAAPSLSAVDGVVMFEPGTVTVRDAPFTLTRPAEVRITDGRARIEDITLTAPGTTASLSGTIGLLGERPIDARLSASGALGFLSSVVPGRVAGEFRADLRAGGFAADPQFTGAVSLAGAAWVWQEQRIAFRDWSGQAAVTADALTIEKLDGHINGGDASVSGAVRFEGAGGTGLVLRVRDAFVEVVKGFRSQADADLHDRVDRCGRTALGQGHHHVRRLP